MTDSPVTRRRALTLMAGGLVGAVAVAAGCASGGSEGPSRSLAATTAPEPQAGTAPSKAAPTKAAPTKAVIYAGPTCACCGDYAGYLRSEGYAVDLRRTEQRDAIRANAGVPDEAASCHTAMVGDYVVEGHVPVAAIGKLLRERPAVDGIALPGRRAGSPGMGGEQAGPLGIVSFRAGRVTPYMTL